jgi:hypothetical protein
MNAFLRLRSRQSIAALVPWRRSALRAPQSAVRVTLTPPPTCKPPRQGVTSGEEGCRRGAAFLFPDGDFPWYSRLFGDNRPQRGALFTLS